VSAGVWSCRFVIIIHLRICSSFRKRDGLLITPTEEKLPSLPGTVSPLCCFSDVKKEEKKEGVGCNCNSETQITWVEGKES